jgi:hypothetical protein
MEGLANTSPKAFLAKAITTAVSPHLENNIESSRITTPIPKSR